MPTTNGLPLVLGRKEIISKPGAALEVARYTADPPIAPGQEVMERFFARLLDAVGTNKPEEAWMIYQLRAEHHAEAWHGLENKTDIARDAERRSSGELGPNYFVLLDASRDYHAKVDAWRREAEEPRQNRKKRKSANTKVKRWNAEWQRRHDALRMLYERSCGIGDMLT